MDDGDGGVGMEAFSLLSHELRLSILEAFFERWSALDPDAVAESRASRGMSYSELMRAVGVDDSGKFNYHLDRLRGVYVERIDDRYVPTASAVALYQTALANRPTASTARATFEIGAACPSCSGRVVGRYEQEFLTVECAECTDWWGLSYGFPKNGLRGREGGELLAALEHRAMHDVALARTGQCPACAGHTTVELPRERLDGERYPTAEFGCETCSWHVTIDAVNALRFAPRVTAALTELGLLPAANAGETAPRVTGSVRSEEPFRVRLAVETAEGSATVVVDGDLGVESVSVEPI